MKLVLICWLCASVLGCGVMHKQTGVLSPNKIERKNDFVSKMVPKKEDKQTNSLTKLSPGGTIKPVPPVTSTNISPPNHPKKEKEAIINIVKPEPPIEPEQEVESFWDRALRYSLFWFGLVGFTAITYFSFKKYKSPKENPFKKQANNTPKKPEQLKLNL